MQLNKLYPENHIAVSLMVSLFVGLFVGIVFYVGEGICALTGASPRVCEEFAMEFTVIVMVAFILIPSLALLYKRLY